MKSNQVIAPLASARARLNEFKTPVIDPGVSAALRAAHTFLVDKDRTRKDKRALLGAWMIDAALAPTPADAVMAYNHVLTLAACTVADVVGKKPHDVLRSLTPELALKDPALEIEFQQTKKKLEQAEEQFLQNVTAMEAQAATIAELQSKLEAATIDQAGLIKIEELTHQLRDATKAQQKLAAEKSELAKENQRLNKRLAKKASATLTGLDQLPALSPAEQALTNDNHRLTSELGKAAAERSQNEANAADQRITDADLLAANQLLTEEVERLKVEASGLKAKLVDVQLASASSQFAAGSACVTLQTPSEEMSKVLSENAQLKAEVAGLRKTLSESPQLDNDLQTQVAGLAAGAAERYQALHHTTVLELQELAAAKDQLENQVLALTEEAKAIETTHSMELAILRETHEGETEHLRECVARLSRVLDDESQSVAAVLKHRFTQASAVLFGHQPSPA